MTSVIATGGCAGWVLRRRHQFEAYDVRERAIGIFNTELDAIDAVLRSREADLAADENDPAR